MINLDIIELITNLILWVAILLTSFIYLTLKINNNFLESSLKSFFWIIKQILLLFIYWVIIILFFPLKIFFKLYLIVISIILKIINIPIRTFLKYGRRLPTNLIWDETELYFYYTTREALGYWNWLRTLSITWVTRVAPDFILNTFYGKSKLFIWGYIIRYCTIFIIFSYLKIKQNMFILFKKLMLLEFVYTIYFFIFFLKNYSKENQRVLLFGIVM